LWSDPINGRTHFSCVPHQPDLNTGSIKTIFCIRDSNGKLMSRSTGIKLF